jgi:hypothetical protein
MFYGQKRGKLVRVVVDWLAMGMWWSTRVFYFHVLGCQVLDVGYQAKEKYIQYQEAHSATVPKRMNFKIMHPL